MPTIATDRREHHHAAGPLRARGIGVQLIRHIELFGDLLLGLRNDGRLDREDLRLSRLAGQVGDRAGDRDVDTRIARQRLTRMERQNGPAATRVEVQVLRSIHRLRGRVGIAVRCPRQGAAHPELHGAVGPADERRRVDQFVELEHDIGVERRGSHVGWHHQSGPRRHTVEVDNAARRLQRAGQRLVERATASAADDRGLPLAAEDGHRVGLTRGEAVERLATPDREGRNELDPVPVHEELADRLVASRGTEANRRRPHRARVDLVAEIKDDDLVLRDIRARATGRGTAEAATLQAHGSRRTAGARETDCASGAAAT